MKPCNGKFSVSGKEVRFTDAVLKADVDPESVNVWLDEGRIPYRESQEILRLKCADEELRANLEQS